MATLRDVRERKLMTRTELAAAVGISESAIFKIEAGTQLPRIPLQPLPHDPPVFASITFLAEMTGLEAVRNGTRCSETIHDRRNSLIYKDVTAAGVTLK